MALPPNSLAPMHRIIFSARCFAGATRPPPPTPRLVRQRALQPACLPVPPPSAPAPLLAAPLNSCACTPTTPSLQPLPALHPPLTCHPRHHPRTSAPKPPPPPPNHPPHPRAPVLPTPAAHTTPSDPALTTLLPEFLAPLNTPTHLLRARTRHSQRPALARQPRSPRLRAFPPCERPPPPLHMKHTEWNGTPPLCPGCWQKWRGLRA